MSRIKRSKKNKKNNELKKILGLALAIGILGTSTSYAYFSSKANISSNLKITMGTLDLNLKCEDNYKKGLINITGLKPSLTDKDCECETDDEFKIENTGSLKQKIKINIKFLENIPPEIVGEVVLQDANKAPISQPIDIQSFNNNDNNFIEVLDLKGKPLVIKPGEILTGVFTVKVKNSINYDNDGKDFDFKINVRATQVNNKDWLWP